MLSRLSLRTSVMAEVIASACLVGTPCDSSFLTCERHDHPGPRQQLAGAFRRTPLGRKPKRSESTVRRDPGGLAYQGEGVYEEGAAAVGLDELRDGAGAGRGRPPLRPLLVPVQERRAPASYGSGHGLLLLLLLPLPRDAAADGGGVGGASRWGAVRGPAIWVGGWVEGDSGGSASFPGEAGSEAEVAVALIRESGEGRRCLYAEARRRLGEEEDAKQERGEIEGRFSFVFYFLEKKNKIDKT